MFDPVSQIRVYAASSHTNKFLAGTKVYLIPDNSTFTFDVNIKQKDLNNIIGANPSANLTAVLNTLNTLSSSTTSKFNNVTNSLSSLSGATTTNFAEVKDSLITLSDDLVEIQNVKTAATNANTAANTASSLVWDSSESKSAATLAKEARDKANQTNNGVTNLQNQFQTEITDLKSQLSGVASNLESQLSTEVSNLEVKIQSMEAVDLQLGWDGGKTATLNNGEWLNVGFNGSNYQYRYSINNGGFSPWGELSNRIYLNLGGSNGLKNIAVQVGREGRIIATKHVGIWKL